MKEKQEKERGIWRNGKFFWDTRALAVLNAERTAWGRIARWRDPKKADHYHELRF